MSPGAPGAIEPGIRPACEADLPALCALLRQLASDDASESTPAQEAAEPAAPEAPTPAQSGAFAALRALPCAEVFVIEEAGRVVGTAQLVVVPSVAGGGRPKAIVDDVVVDRAFRGRGLGERLVRHCIEAARARGVRKLQLASNQRRAAAHRFYERLGFAPSHRGYSMLF